MTVSDRTALRAVAAQFFVNGLVYATVLPRLPEVRERVGISTGALGVILMVGSAAGVVGSVLAGRVVARFGTRDAMVGSAILSALGLPIIGFATDPLLLVLGFFVVMFFDVFADVAMNVQGSVLSARRSTPVMNRLHGLWSLATVSGGLLGAALVGLDIGVPVHFVVIAAAMVVVEFVIRPFLLPVDEPHEHTVVENTPDRDVVVSFETETTGPDGTVSEQSPEPANRRAWRAPAALTLGVWAAAAMVMEVVPGDWAAIRLTDDLGASGELAAAAFVSFTAGMTLGRFGGDWVQVRVGVERMLVLSSALAGLGLLAATLSGASVPALAGLLVAGLGISVQFPQLYDQAARLPGPPGSGFTDLLVGQRLAALVTPVVVGALANTDALGVGDAMAIVALPSAAVALLLSVRRWRGVS